MIGRRVQSIPLLPALAIGLVLAGCDKAPAPPVVPKQAKTEAPPSLAFAGRVTDAANLLDDAARKSLDTRLAAIEARTKHQLVVATTRSLGGRDIADYTRELANAWGVGRAGANDGVVIMLAPNERKVRIAVGYGLEHVLGNEFCKQVIEQHMTPHLKANDFAGAFGAAIDAIDAKFETGSNKRA